MFLKYFAEQNKILIKIFYILRKSTLIIMIKDFCVLMYGALSFKQT